MPSKRRSAEERFMEKVSPCPITGCWWWTGATGHGRARFSDHGKAVAAARFALSLRLGRYPVQANHTCDQGMCVNPDHLYEGTQLENVRDMHRRGRDRNQFETMDTCKRGHPLSGPNLYLRKDRPGRICRACNLEGVKRYAKQKRQAAQIL